MSTVAYKSWDEVKGNLTEKKLRDALDALVKKHHKSKGKKSDKLFACLSYSYGELVVDQGTFCPPGLLADAKDRETLFKHIGLNRADGETTKSPRIPLGFVAKNSGGKLHGILEASFSINRNIESGADWKKLGYPQREILPQALLLPGSLFGLFEYFDFHQELGDPPAYDVSAGCRSPFIVTNFGATGLQEALNFAFSPKNQKYLKDETWEKFEEGQVPLSNLIRELLPTASAEYNTEIVLIPLVLLADGRDAAVREFLRIALEEAWDQSAHLRNGFIEMLNTKKFIGKWLKKNSQIPPDYFEPMTRFIYGVEWVIKGQVPGYRIYHNGNCGVCGDQQCSGGPFSELLEKLDVIFAKRSPHLRCLLLLPEYFSNCKNGMPVYVPSRLNRRGRHYGKRPEFETRVEAAFRMAKETLPLLSNAELIFETRTKKSLKLDDFGIPPKLTLKTTYGSDSDYHCTPHRHHWFFYDGFARIQKS